MKTILAIIGGIFLFIGIWRFVNIYETEKAFGSLLNNPWSQEMMKHQMDTALILCGIGIGLFLISRCFGFKKWLKS